MTFLCVNTISDKVVGLRPIYGVKMVCGGRPLPRENLAETHKPKTIHQSDLVDWVYRSFAAS